MTPLKQLYVKVKNAPLELIEKNSKLWVLLQIEQLMKAPDAPQRFFDNAEDYAEYQADLNRTRYKEGTIK